MPDIYQKVLVSWVDISSYDGAWMDLEEAIQYSPINVETCGWMIKETNDYVVIASTLSVEKDNKVIGSVNAIPRGCIVCINSLEAPF